VTDCSFIAAATSTCHKTAMQQRFNVRYCGFIAARCGCFVVVQTAYRVTLFDHFTLVQSIHLAIMPLCGCLRV